MKILNLYAGIGGNRKLWGDEHKITAIELNPEIAQIYKNLYPNDEVIITDAHKFLLENLEGWDFIWSSPPCPTHSRARKFCAVPKCEGEPPQNSPIYPDMKLYEEIIFLDGYCKSKWVVENVIGFYKPLIRPFELGRHYFWANFVIPNIRTEYDNIRHGKTFEMAERKGVDFEVLDGYKERKDTLLRNCVEPELGLYILKQAFKGKQEVLI